MFRAARFLSSLLSVLIVAGLSWAQAKPASAPGAPSWATTVNNAAFAAPTQQPYSERVVRYEIDARLDPGKHTIDATETLTWRNLTGQPQDHLPFHLYLNAFQKQSTFMAEARRNGATRDNPDFGWKEKMYGADEIKSLEVEGMGDLTSKIKFTHPDDGNADDRTVFEIALPRPIAPGASAVFHIKFHDVLPEVVARTGYKRDFFMIGQWFPKVGVWWQGAWNCHQFHENTEFFADFGVYDVKLTVPKDYITGATGVEMANGSNPDGTRTVTYHAEDVHDFSWTADPHYVVVEDDVTLSSGTVHARLLMHPGHMASAPRYMQALKGTMKHFDDWYGPYPYKQITVVDPAHAAFEAGGMEYPTLITAGTTWWAPAGARFPEVVVEHEFGHQYWYAMVATNEFEDAWLDEGINSYTEVKIMADLYGKNNDSLNLLGITGGGAALQRISYLRVADTDPLTRPAWLYMSGPAYGGVTYGKTATVMMQLEGLLGEDTMRRAIHTYFMRYRFKHPNKEDVLKTIEEVSGQDLRWYYNQAVYGTAVLDYEIKSVRSERVDWYEDEKKKPEKKGETIFRDEVVVHRKGDFLYPVRVLIRFEDGEQVRERWDGVDRWIRYTYERKSKIASAEIDPDYQVLLDKNLYNNSYVQKGDMKAHFKLANAWLFLTQFLAQMAAWLA